MYPTREEELEQDKREGQIELVKCKAMKTLLTNNSLAATISIAGMEIGLCRNDLLFTVIEYQEAEIRKFLKGDPNDYE